MMLHRLIALLLLLILNTANAEDLISPQGAKTVKHHAGIRLTGIRAPYTGSSTELYALPLLQYNYGTLFAGDRVGLGSFIGVLDDWIIGVSLGLGFADTRRNDIGELNDLPELRDGLAANLLSVKQFEWGDIAISVSKEVAGASNGWDADIFYFYTHDVGRWSFQPSMVLNWQSHDVTDYAYGVHVTGREQYRGRSSLNLFPEMIVTYQLWDQWRLHTSIGYIDYGSGITDSPIVDKSGRWSAYAGLAWHWESPYPF